MTAMPIEQTPPCTCDAGRNEPHAEDCPRAKRMHPYRLDDLAGVNSQIVGDANARRFHRKGSRRRLEMIEFTAPIRIESEANRRDHWRVKAKRVAAQRRDVTLAFRAAKGRIPFPCVVTITRIAPRPIADSDNLQGGCKAVRDAIAACCGVDDRSTGYKWRYEQRKGPYGVSVRIEGLEVELMIRTDEDIPF